MSQQFIDIGTSPNDGTGDTLRAGATKINANFTELYSIVKGAAWVFSDHSNADPSWPAGSFGFVSGGDRGTAGDSNYVQNGSLIFVTDSGVLYK